MRPDYASCTECDEYRQAALRKSAIGLCHNCADNAHPRGYCWACKREDLPLERHHLAGRRHANFTVPICLNCHALLSRRQYEWLDLWRGESCSLFLAWGFLDYCVLASRPAMPYELFSEQCEETMVVATQKIVAAMSHLFKILLLVAFLLLARELFKAYISKSIQGVPYAQ